MEIRICSHLSKPHLPVSYSYQGSDLDFLNPSIPGSCASWPISGTNRLLLTAWQEFPSHQCLALDPGSLSGKNGAKELPPLNILQRKAYKAHSTPPQNSWFSKSVAAAPSKLLFKQDCSKAQLKITRHNFFKEKCGYDMYTSLHTGHDSGRLVIDHSWTATYLQTHTHSCCWKIEGWPLLSLIATKIITKGSSFRGCQI